MLFNTLNDYSTLSRVGVLVIDEDGVERFATPEYERAKVALDYIADLLNIHEQCNISMIYGCYQSIRFGGRYIFMCPRGFTFFTSPIIRDGMRKLSVIGGPVLMMDYDDYIEFDVTPRAKTVDRDELRDVLKSIPIVDSGFVTTLSEQLSINAAYLSDSSSPILPFPSGDAEASADGSANERLVDYINSVYFSENTGERGMIDVEQRLIEALARHDEYPAKALRDEILGQILFHTGKNLELIKSRIMQLIILLSRAAIRDGSDMKHINQLKSEYFVQIDEPENLTELIIWFNGVLEQFTNIIFSKPNSKHQVIIRDSIAYLREHYAEKISLEDVAAQVFLSPSYLSKLFHEETGSSFKSVLNRIRVEQSKELLRNTQIGIAEIAGRVGFEDQSYFTKVFKRYEGVAPNRSRNSVSSEE